jgi:hypothetical protein
MDQRIYHGNFKNTEIAEALIGHFNQGALRVQQVGTGDFITVQIATSPNARVGGNTALSISLQNVEDGVAVQIGQQAWLGIAANLGVSTLAAIQNPLSLLGRLGDIAQDIDRSNSSQYWLWVSAFRSTAEICLRILPNAESARSSVMHRLRSSSRRYPTAYLPQLWLRHHYR